MKLSKTGWIVITVGAFIIILAGLGLVRLQQIQEQTRLNNELVQSKLELSGVQLEQLSAQKAELEKQLKQIEQTTSEYEISQATLSQNIETVIIIKSMYDVAANSEVEVTQVNSSEQSEQLEGINCSTRTISAKISGDMANLVNFITTLNGSITTGVIKSVTVTIPPASSNGTALADIILVVYKYNGG